MSNPGGHQQGQQPPGGYSGGPAPQQRSDTWLIVVAAILFGVICGGAIYFFLGRSSEPTVTASSGGTEASTNQFTLPDPGDGSSSERAQFVPLETPTALAETAQTPDEATTPEPGATPTATQPTPSPQATAAATPSPAATPAPTPRPILPSRLSCNISNNRIGVDETTTYTGSHQPEEAAVDYEFDHGDGTRDPRNPSFAAYSEPGSYTVTMIATLGATGEKETLTCGIVVVTTDGPAPPELPPYRCVVDTFVVDIGETVTFRALDADDNDVVSSFSPGDGRPVSTGITPITYDRTGTFVIQVASADQTATADCPAVTVIAPEAPVLPGPIQVACFISNAGEDRVLDIQVGEPFQIRGIAQGIDEPVEFRFAHGDGTLDQRQLEFSDAVYFAPGTYVVTAEWRFTDGPDTRWKQLRCGTVTAR